MHFRTVLLLALLALVAQSSVAPAAVPAPSHHPRIEDDAAIPAPFVPRLGRMADAYSTDLGIDVRVVTSIETAASIDEQANAMFEREQAGDPTLELFTDGSRLLRSYYPLAPFEEARRLERLQASAPLQYIVQGDYAVATSKRPAQGFVPVLLHREDGLWRIDLVETWKNLFFDADGNYFLRNSNTPYAFALKQFGQGQYFNMHALPLRGVTLPRWLEALDQDDVLASMWRAELWLRNGFVAPRALLDYERALRLAPRDPWVLETFGERARYLGFPELAIPALAAIGRGVEMSLADACNEAGDREGARHWVEQALAQNPYDLHALRWQRFLAERDGNQDEVQRMDAQLAKLMQDPERAYQLVMLYFKPEMPRFEADAPVDVEGTRVFDHSKFGVTIQNTSNRPVEIESVKLTSVGNEYLYFDKQWGFVKDTGHSHVRYVFHTCWHGVGTEVRQCRTQWVDTMPFIPNPQ